MNFPKTYYTLTPTLNSAWQPEAATNQQILADSGIKSSWKYRQYMQNNAKNIMKTNTMQYIQDSGNNAYIDGIYNLDGKTIREPLLYKSIQDNSEPRFGSNSDLKNMYLSKQQNSATLTSPSISIRL
jgi:hypothetical protein